MNSIKSTQNNGNTYTVNFYLRYSIPSKAVSIGAESADGILPVELDELSARGGGNHENH